MKTQTIAVTAVAALVLAAAGYGLYSLGMNSGMRMAAPAAPATAAAPAAAAEKKILYWHDPMVPGARFDKPGKSPFMDMQLVPVYAEEGTGAGAGGVSIDPRVQQNLGVRTVEVEKGAIGARIEGIGSVAYDESASEFVRARSTPSIAYVERLLVRVPLERVRAGQPLAELYIPDWITAVNEYRAVLRMGTRAPAGLMDATRQRMLLAGMSQAQIRMMQLDGSMPPRFTVTSPIAGVVTELVAREGMAVPSGTTLFRVTNLATVWVTAEVPEAAASEIRPGTQAEARTAAYPDTVFKGKVITILPEVNPATRTLKARVEVRNPGEKLLPGMFARVTFAPAVPREGLLVPSEAVIRTGTRDLVVVARPEGGFAPVEVEIGAESGGRTEIRKGLKAGDKVVASGQFLLDSEASLKGVESRMQPQAGAPK